VSNIPGFRCAVKRAKMKKKNGGIGHGCTYGEGAGKNPIAKKKKKGGKNDFESP